MDQLVDSEPTTEDSKEERTKEVIGLVVAGFLLIVLAAVGMGG
jgi:hypothetical protein